MTLAIRLQIGFNHTAIAVLERVIATLVVWQERQRARQVARERAAFIASLDSRTLDDLGIDTSSGPPPMPSVYAAMGHIYCAAALCGVGREMRQGK